MDWFVLTLVSTFLYGIQGFLTKIAAERKCNSFIVTFSFTLTVSLISLLLLFSTGPSTTEISSYFLLLSIANGSLYSLETISKLEALKKIRASIAFPFIRMSTIIVVVWAVIFIGETLTIKSIIGILLSLTAIYLLESEAKK